MSDKIQKSVHNVDASKLTWSDRGECWRGTAEIGIYTVRIFAGDSRYSSPAYKLASPNNYSHYEVHVLKDGKPVCLRSLLLQVATSEEENKMSVQPGIVQPDVHHRDVYRILALVKYIASLEAWSTVVA